MQHGTNEMPSATPEIAATTGDQPAPNRVVRVPYKSYGATRAQVEQAPSDQDFKAWAKARNRRLVHMAAGRPMQPPALPPLSEYATSYVNNRSTNNDLLNSMRRAVSDAPATAGGPVALPVARRGLRVPVGVLSGLPPVTRAAPQHPWVRTPAIPSLSRKNFPALVVLMILIWVAAVGVGVYKGMQPRSGFILYDDRF